MFVGVLIPDHRIEAESKLSWQLPLYHEGRQSLTQNNYFSMDGHGAKTKKRLALQLEVDQMVEFP